MNLCSWNLTNKDVEKVPITHVMQNEIQFTQFFPRTKISVNQVDAYVK